MTLHSITEETLRRDLGDGLLMRRASPADTEALVEFNGRIHSDDGPDRPDKGVAAWTRDLMEKAHPTFSIRDFTLVEDTKTGAIVSSLNLIPQTWSYAGIPFEVGRPELVGTQPEYRGRGLVRAQFEVIHAWSAARGHRLQAITGIPYYYRLFGYEMALSLGGGRAGYKVHVPQIKEGESEPYRVRASAEADLPFIARLYEIACRRSLVSCSWDADLWRYELAGKSPANVNRYELRVIETAGGDPVGFLAHPDHTWNNMLPAAKYELQPGLSWAAVTPSVIRYLYATGEAYAKRDGKPDKFGAFGFWGGDRHPVYDVLKTSLPLVRPPYAWYVRVADLPGFVRLVRPALEARLAESPLTGHTGELKLTFYRSGIRLAFQSGAISEVEAWRPEPVGHSGDAAFPGLTFLQLLFGYRSLDEILSAFPDAFTDSDTTYALLNALFPKAHSNVWPIA